jgi:hypothetical protein
MAYACQAQIKVPPLEEYEEMCALDKLVRVHKQRTKKS